MSTEAIIALAAAFTISFCTIFPSMAQGSTSKTAMESIAP